MQPPSVAAIALNAVSGSAALPKADCVTLQAMLYGNQAAHLHLRIETAEGLDATAVTTSQMALGHTGDSGKVRLPSKQTGTPRVYWLFTDAAGAALGAVAAGNVLLVRPENDD